MPARHILYQLSQLPTAPRSQIGVTGELLGDLWEQNIPVPETICIPGNALAELAQDPQLHLKLEQLQRSSAAQHHSAIQQHVLFLLKRTHLDRNFLHSLALMYHEYLQADTVQVYASNGTAFRVELVMGDAAVITAVLEVWSTAIASTIVKQPRRRKPISELVSSSAILISRQPQPIASGVAYSLDPTTGSKTQVVIKTVWGAQGPDSLSTAASIAVDVRTLQVVATVPGTQETQYQQGSGAVTSQKLDLQHKHSLPLADSDARTLVQYVLQLKRKSLSQVTITWIRTTQALLITGVSELDSGSLQQNTTREHTTQQSHTKLYITGGNPAKAAEQLAFPVDGVGILRSEFCLAQHGTHPEQLLHSHHRDILRQNMLHTLTTYQREARGKRVLFRTENFTSAELLQLRASAAYTEAETNPAIGLRGALKHLQQPELLKFQLAVFAEAVANAQSPLGLLFPFVRSGEECLRLLQYVRELRLNTSKFAGVWLQLNTPENILSLSEYPLSELKGVVFNVSSVLALARGIDSDRPELHEAYSFPEHLYAHLLEHLVTYATPTNSLELLIYLRHYHSAAVTAAVRAGVHGIIVRPSVASLAKASIMETEQALLNTHS